MVASPAKAIFDMLYLNASDVGGDEVARIDFSGIHILIESCPRAPIRALARYLKERNNG